MDLGQAFRQQAVARHHEEDAGLAEDHHQDDRRQGQEGGGAQGVADLGVTDDAQDVGQRLVGADQHFGVGGQGAGGDEGGRARLNRFTGGAQNRLSPDGAGGAERDQQIEDRADGQRADQADGHVTLRILGFLGRRRNGVEPDIGEEDRGRGADDAHARILPEQAVGCEGRQVGRLDDGQGDDDEDRQGDDLDRDQKRVDAGRLRRADHQQAGHQQGHDDGGNVDDPG